MKSRKRVAYRDGPHPVDVYVGRRLRERRVLMGLSQERLADGVGLTFQQIHKYERGANRISASKLWEFSRILGVPVEWFFEGAAGYSKPKDQLYMKTETLKLVRYFLACPQDVRGQLRSLVNAVAEAKGGK